MKLAIVSDIHADPVALARALADMPPVDRILCAGDAVSDFRFCAETVGLLRRHEVACIQGNHEFALFNRNPAYLEKCRAAHDAEALSFLSEAPTSIEIEAAGARLLMIHATPWEPFSGYVRPGSPHLARIGELPYDFVVLGHTHAAMVERVGAVTVINPGSCAEPRETDRRCSYALVDLETRAVEIRRLDRAG